LDDVNEMVNWQAIEHFLCDIHAKRRGNTSWPPLFMFKALLLQSWRLQTFIYGLCQGLYDALAQAQIDVGSLKCVSPLRLNKPAAIQFRQWVLDAAQQWHAHH
jgi:hypothetical protein